MMDNVNAGIVGNGFVGNAVYQNLRDKVKCKVFDVDKNRCFSPLEEVIHQDFIFVCLPTPMRKDGSCDLSILDNFFEACFPKIPSVMVSSDESEAIKYFSNVFLAYKVAYFNKIYDFCQATGMEYDNVRKGVTGDSRIGKSHTQVPGIDNDRGFGGTCFPKDLNSLITQFEERGVNCDMLKEVWLYNEEIRTVIDWPVT